MNGKFLLDTNIIIALFAEDPIIKERLEQIEEVFIPCIVLGELYYGAEKSKKIKINMKKIDDFSVSNQIIGVNGETSKFYATIKIDLHKKGYPIPENDIWISAIAQQHKLTLISRDNHFKEVENLKFEFW
jgi:tRNA(fMet)-specific endonuclease VapC